MEDLHVLISPIDVKSGDEITFNVDNSEVVMINRGSKVIWDKYHAEEVVTNAPENPPEPTGSTPE
jgi:hypothetical protein